ncbi:hypothetical protein [Streptomyces sp. TS71-3]|uniref:hypothetical protein n=1 Tax=Streptomyces sp. TS71-3 TaxID=2733862 RepID=UPI001B0FD565|nr:hypothetical protein [Streptomyces sp. TS71-3]GHJ35658.1 hypothetical protein Sm713_12670 [Streptomyces sp. TS71-3]
MSIRTRQLAATAAAVAAVALSAVAGGAGAASAADAGDIAFYTGAGQSGTAIPVDADSAGTCRNLPEPALSGLNYAVNDVEVYFNADCATGAPGSHSDLYYVLGSLHTGTFPYAAVSYRVLPAS